MQSRDDGSYNLKYKDEPFMYQLIHGGAPAWIGGKGERRLAVVGTPLMSETKVVKKVELLDGVEDTGVEEEDEEEDEGGGVGVEEERVGAKNEEVSREDEGVLKVDVGVGVVNVGVNEEAGASVVVIVLVSVSVLACGMIVTVFNEFRTPVVLTY